VGAAAANRNGMPAPGRETRSRFSANLAAPKSKGTLRFFH